RGARRERGDGEDAPDPHPAQARPAGPRAGCGARLRDRPGAPRAGRGLMAERLALVRRPSSRMAEGIVTYGERVPADPALAARQHEAYVAALADAGWAIRQVARADELPDSAFVEDTVVTCGELAVLTRPGAPERRAELAGTEEALRALGLEVERIEEPGTLDGGDALRVGST